MFKIIDIHVHIWKGKGYLEKFVIECKRLKLYKEGFKGIKIINPTKNYDDKEFYSIYEKAEKYKMPVLFHTGVVARTKKDKYYDVSSNRMRPIYLDTIARAFPGLNIIGGHLGVPWHEEAAMVMRINPNVYFDMTGSIKHGWRSNKTASFFKNLFYWPNAFNKILFGSDVIIEEIEESIKIYKKMLEPLKLSKDVLNNIYYNTASKLLRLNKKCVY